MEAQSILIYIVEKPSYSIYLSDRDSLCKWFIQLVHALAVGVSLTTWRRKFMPLSHFRVKRNFCCKQAAKSQPPRGPCVALTYSHFRPRPCLPLEFWVALPMCQETSWMIACLPYCNNTNNIPRINTLLNKKNSGLIMLISAGNWK